MVRYVEEIGVGKGHSFSGVHHWGYSRRFRLELSEGSSRFVDLKEEVHIQYVFSSYMADGAECSHTIGMKFWMFNFPIANNPRMVI